MKNDTRFAIHAKRRFGFTLIELLIVIAVMGTLITILLPNFIGARQRSKDARRKLDIEQITSALEQYRSVAGVYPTTLELDCDAARETVTYDTGSATFLSTIPQDPGCSTYVYTVQTLTTTDYSICTYLEATTITTPPSNPNTSCGGSNCNYCKGPYGNK